MGRKEKVTMCLWCNSVYDHIPDSGICPKCGYNHFGEYDMTFSEEETQAVVLKLGNLSTLDSMRSGSIWLQSPKYYQDFKGNPAVCDVSECAYDFILDIPVDVLAPQIPFKIGDRIVFDGRELILKEIIGAKACVYSNTQNYNRLLCFYMMKIQNGILDPRDSKLKSFGSHFCLVDIKKLSKKMTEYAEANGLSAWLTNVKYTTNAYRGAYNPTCKGDAYSYQNEYRCIFRGDSLNALPEKEPLKIHLDGMDEIITEPQPTEKLFEISTSKELFDLFGIKE